MADTGRTIGPYILERRIGAGGMGVVHRARHRESGESVALKTLAGVRADLVDSLRREIHALARLRHPDIVRIVEHGVQDAVPWLAMELLAGTSLRSWMDLGGMNSREGTTRFDEASPTTPLGAGEVASTDPVSPSRRTTPARRFEEARAGVAILGRLCVPLAYLHGEGLVHRDLKPENVVVRPGDRPVIVDFGIAATFGRHDSREVLADASQDVSGTVSYMAPEQARGELVDARADLYALGCILYEMLAGEPPFTGPPGQVIWMHASATPPALAARCDGLPPEVEDTVMALLEKEPRRRPGYAKEIEVRLAAHAPSRPLSRVAAPEARPYLYRPGLAGRETPLARLGTFLEDARHGRGAVAVIAGPSGVGKTRLALEAARAARAAGLGVLVAEGAPGLAHRSMAGVLRAIANRCRERGGAESARLLGSRARTLAAYEPELATVTGVSAESPASALEGPAALLRLANDLADTLAALAMDDPHLLLIDDVQWADELALAWLDLIRRSDHLDHAPLVVLVTLRTDAGRASDAVRRALGDAPVIQLEELEAADVGAIVRDMLAVDVAPPGLVRALARGGRGNPFLVAELLRSAVARGLLVWEEGRRWLVAASGQAFDEIPTPRSVQELLRQRVDGLPAVSLGTLRAAALFERGVAFGTLERMTPDASDGAQELIRQGILEAHEGRLRFHHGQVAAFVQEQLSPEALRELHAAAARALTAERDTGAAVDPGELARHLEGAGDPASASPLYVEAAESARVRHAYGEAIQHFEGRLRTCVSPSLASVTAHRTLGKLIALTGDPEPAIAHHRQAVADARAVGHDREIAESLRHLAGVLRELGRAAEARGLALEALALARRSGDRSGEGSVLTLLGNIAWQTGDHAEAGERHAAALAIHQQIGDRMSEALTLGNMANLAWDTGRLEECLALFEQALQIDRATSNPIGLANNLANRAGPLVVCGRVAEARDSLEESLAIVERVGLHSIAPGVLNNLGGLHHQSGDAATARRYFERSVAAARTAGRPRLEVDGLTNLATVAVNESRITEARSLLARAREIVLGLGDRPTIAAVEMSLADSWMATGEFDAAERHLDGAGALLVPGDRRYSELAEKRERLARLRAAARPRPEESAPP
ncbi:MAG: tetratricopeptide repeat protein [Acidobacteriota bacterium]